MLSASNFAAEYESRPSGSGRRVRSATRNSIDSACGKCWKANRICALRPKSRAIVDRQVPGRRMCGVLLRDGRSVSSEAVIVTTGHVPERACPRR